MRVLVVGGTGFIGYHIVQALRKKNAVVSVLCRNADVVAALFGEDVAALRGDVGELQTADYIELLKGFDGIVFAAGADERSKIEGDAEEFFYRANVWPCEQLFAAIPQTSVRHAVLLNSVFLWLDQQSPDLELTRHHPYIRSRVAQNAVAQAAVRDSACVLATLLVPWIFGASPHRQTQWSSLVNYVRGAVPLMCIKGGANMMSVESLAQAVCGALEYTESSGTYPVGDCNLHYTELMQRLCEPAGRKDQHVYPVSDDFFRDLGHVGNFFSRVFGIQSGLGISQMADLLLQDIFYDPAPSQALFQYAGGDLSAAFAATVADVPESKLLGGWRNSLNWFASK
ncbi:MAG TPA: NAD(P)H-binding protein [Pseudomonadales bacterium]|nr:NAD(P)H-binding protein [Pseudomonadales bacterium]